MIAEKAVQSRGPLLMNPDPDEARKYFRSKSRAQEGKLMSLKDAVERFVKDGDYLAIGGFGTNRTPIAACQEIVRQGRKTWALRGIHRHMISKSWQPERSLTGWTSPISLVWRHAA